MTAVIVAILASIALPNYGKAVRRGRGQSARDVLLTIFAGEKTFQALNGQYFQVNAGANQAMWQTIFLENPDLNTDVRFSVPNTFDDSNPANDRFNAVASYSNAANDFMRIDQTGVITCLQTTGIFANTPATGCMQ